MGRGWIEFFREKRCWNQRFGVGYTVLQVRKEGLLEDTETSPTMRETHRPSSWFVSGVLRWGSNGGGRGGWDGGKWPGFGQNEWHNNTNHITQTDRSRWVHWGWIQHLKKKSL